MLSIILFQIVSADGKHSCTLQGESKHQCEEWIATVRNISAGLYLEDNPREAIDRARQASMSETSTSPSPTDETKQESSKLCRLKCRQKRKASYDFIYSTGIRIV